MRSKGYFASANLVRYHGNLGCNLQIYIFSGVRVMSNDLREKKKNAFADKEEKYESNICHWVPVTVSSRTR